MIPYPDQNKEDTSFISVVACGVYIPLSRPIQFRPLPNQNFEENTQDPGDSVEPWIQDPSGFLQISWGFNRFVKGIPCHIKHYNMDNQAQ